MVVCCQSCMSEANLNTPFASLPFILSLHMWMYYSILIPYPPSVYCSVWLFHPRTLSCLLFNSKLRHQLSSRACWLFQLFSFLLSRRVSHCTENSKSISGFWSAWIFGLSRPRFSSSLYPLATPGKMWSTELLKRAEWSLPCFLTRS